MVRTAAASALLALLVAGCATPSPRARPRPRPIAYVAVERYPSPDWRTIATPEDQRRLEALKASWTTARAAVKGRAAVRLAREGALIDPDAALDLPTMTPGPYRCRLVRIGWRKGYVTFPPDICYVDGDAKAVSLTKQTGENLPGGWLHADTDRRLIFLGTFRQQAAAAAPPYGEVSTRDVAGVVERIGPLRWRLVLTKAGRGALLDLYELVPIAPAMPAS